MRRSWFLVSGIFILAIILVTITSCGQNQPEEEEMPEIIEAFQQDEVELTFYFFTDASTGAKSDAQTVLSEAAAVSGLSISLNFQWIPVNQYIPLIKSLSHSDQPFDGFYCFDPSPLAFDFAQLARTGLIKDLTSLLPVYAPELYIQYTSADLASAQVDGKLFAIPSLYPLSYSTYAIVREDLKELYGIPDITSFDDYAVYLAEIKSQELGLIPGKMAGFVVDQFIGTSGYAVLDPFLGLLYDWEDPNMQIIPLEQTPEFQEIAQTIMYWNDAEYLHKSGSASFEIWEATRKLMTAGEIASFLITPEFNPGLSVEQLVSQLEQAMMVSTNRDTQSARLEAYRLYPDEMVQRVRGPMGLGWTGSAIAFHASSPNVERGLQFLNWVQSSQENYDMLLYGLEGQHYELSSNGQIAYPAGMNFQNSTYMGWSGRWAFENIRFDRTPQGFPETSKEQRVAYIREKTRYAPHEGFFLDTEALDVFYEQRALALVELIYFPLLNGSYKPEETGAIIDGLNQSGAETLVEMVQQQLNLWRSAQ